MTSFSVSINNSTCFSARLTQNIRRLLLSLHVTRSLGASAPTQVKQLLLLRPSARTAVCGKTNHKRYFQFHAFIFSGRLTLTSVLRSRIRVRQDSGDNQNKFEPGTLNDSLWKEAAHREDEKTLNLKIISPNRNENGANPRK